MPDSVFQSGFAPAHVWMVPVVTDPLGTVAAVPPEEDNDDVGFLRDVLPLLEFLGGTLVAEAGPGDFPVRSASSVNSVPTRSRPSHRSSRNSSGTIDGRMSTGMISPIGLGTTAS